MSYFAGICGGLVLPHHILQLCAGGGAWSPAKNAAAASLHDQGADPPEAGRYGQGREQHYLRRQACGRLAACGLSPGAGVQWRHAHHWPWRHS